jgi:hypothetical protein
MKPPQNEGSGRDGAPADLPGGTDRPGLARCRTKGALRAAKTQIPPMRQLGDDCVVGIRLLFGAVTSSLRDHQCK